MPPPARRPIELDPGTSVADAVSRAHDAATTRADAAGVDAAYRDAVRLAAGDPMLWAALAGDHVEKLRALGRATLALQRCNEYLSGAGASHVSLWVQRAEIRSALGDHSAAGADAVAIRTTLGSRPDSLTLDDNARLHRVEGLSAADQDDRDRAVGQLNTARRIFLGIGNRAGLAAIELDRLSLGVREGEEGAVSAVLSGAPSQTASDVRLRAMALRRQLRYEEALVVLLRGAIDHELDPALRWTVLYDLILLLRLIRQDGIAERLLPLLAEAGAVAADPAAVADAAARLSAEGAPSDAVCPQFDRRVQHARRLIIDGLLDKAESLIIELRSQARTDRDIATWHLAAGELELARYEIAGDRSFAQEAAGHLSKAAEHASMTALVEVRACALGLLGDAWDEFGAHEQAVDSWAEAHHLEERIAGRQITDEVRIGMLQAVPDEYDKRIETSAKRLRKRVADATATAVVTEASAATVVTDPGAATAVGEAIATTVDAMEASRGATILGRILPGEAGPARDLPRPSDLNGAWRWVEGIVRDLPLCQVVWIMHPTPDRVHHAILGQGLLHHTCVSSGRDHLTSAIDKLTSCWSDDESLEWSIADGQFDKQLDEVAAQVGIDAVIPKLPPRVRRIAIVAGDALSDIPFVAMKMPGAAEPLGIRFALSDLPCLSARLTLHRRACQ